MALASQQWIQITGSGSGDSSEIASQAVVQPSSLQGFSSQLVGDMLYVYDSPQPDSYLVGQTIIIS